MQSTIATSYDAIGNVTSVDGPLPGSVDTATYRYDAVRRQIGIISPDPDGAGPLKHRAVRTYYTPDSRLATVSVGTINGQSESDWGSFSELQATWYGYDYAGRKIKELFRSNTTNYSFSQFEYDIGGRLICSAQRMEYGYISDINDANTPACTHYSNTEVTIQAYGPDRITRNIYNAADELLSTETGYNVPGQSRVEATYTYTPNGKVATFEDAIRYDPVNGFRTGNLTTYVYDGFDRLVQTRHPNAANGATSSTTDYDGFTYDPNGNVTQRRLRDGQVVGFTYDNLNRVTYKDVPNSVIHEYDISYQYDLQGRLTQAADSNTHYSAFGYDALGRKTSESSNWTTRGFQYDTAGRRTRLTWGDGLYVTYDYLVTGEVTAIRENGSTVLGSYAYDDHGRRTSLTRGNGVVTSYGFDGGSRLTSLVHDFAGTSQDVTTTFAHNPVGQIARREVSNDSYAWTAHVNTYRLHATNGLNQHTSAGSVGFSYDGRGNLTNSDSNVYGYTSENRLATGPNGHVMTWDPLGRYHWIYSWNVGGPFLWMQYDGDALIEERDANGVARRYVHGPGGDEPLMWYEGSGTGDKRWLVADERGSVVAVTNGSGVATTINTYDEYGIPGSGNVGRFQYTGQAWLPELGMYHYKARLYSPTLGRFLQADPIGTAGGLNLYRYAGNDPINRSDPSGLYDGDIVCCNARYSFDFWWYGFGGGFNYALPSIDFGGGGGFGGGMGPGPDAQGEDTIVVSATQPKPQQRQSPLLNITLSPLNLSSVPLIAAGAAGAEVPQSGHSYDTTEQVCRVPLSQGQRGLINRATAVPDGTINGSRSAGTYPVGGWLFGVIPTIGGYVTTRFSADGNIAVNTTTSAHLFVGTITRTIYSNSGGTFIRTVGSGNAGSGIVGRTRDAINDAAGPGIFRDANGLSRTVAKQLNPSC